MGIICSSGKVVQVDKTQLPNSNSTQSSAQKLSLKAEDIQSANFSVESSPFHLTRADAELILTDAKPGSYSLTHDMKSELFISLRTKRCVIHHSISKNGSSLFVGGERFADVKAIISHFRRHPLGDIHLTEEVSTVTRPSVQYGIREKSTPVPSESSSGVHSHSLLLPVEAEQKIGNDLQEPIRAHKKTGGGKTEDIAMENKENADMDLITPLTKPQHPNITKLQRSLSQASVSSAGEKDLPIDEPLPILPEPTGARPPPLYPRFSTLTRGVSSISLERTSDIFDMKHILFQLFKGNVTVNYPPQRRKLKVFVIGQNDTINERKHMINTLLPNIVATCQSYSYDCNVCDTSILHASSVEDFEPCWAVDNGYERLKAEVEECKTYQLPVLVVVYMGQKYGPFSFPAQLPLEVFESLQLNIKSKESTQNLTRLYELNTNTVPSCFRLKKGLTAEDISEHKVLLEELMQLAFSSIKKGKNVWKHFAPAFERDIEHVKEHLPEAQLVLIRREIEDLDVMSNKGGKFPKQFSDSPDANSYYQLQAQQEELKKEVVKMILSEDANIKYTVSLDQVENGQKWIPREVEERITAALMKATNSLLSDRCAQNIDRWLQSEILYHVERSASLSKKFPLQRPLKQTIKAYLEGPYNKPLVIYSGCAHSREVAAAKVSDMSIQLLGDCCCLVTRYIGRTPDATSMTLLIQSICLQLSRAYGTDPSAVPQELKDLVVFLPILLQLATDSQPLVICLCDLQLVEKKSAAFNLFSFIPRKLGNFVKVVLIGSNEVHESASKCFNDQNSFTCIPENSFETAQQLFTKISEHRSRTLVEKQKDEVAEILKTNPDPAMVKLLQAISENWTSSHENEPVPVDMQSCFRYLVKQLEMSFPSCMITELLNYLTVANAGINEACLVENVLRKTHQDCRDAREYTFCRLDLDLRMLLRSLGEMIQTETLHGETVFRWSDDTYSAAVRTMQLEASDEAKYISNIVQHLEKTPNTFAPHQENQEKEEKLACDPAHNIFKFSFFLAYLVQMKKPSSLKSLIFCNYDYLRTKLEAMSVSHLVDDLSITLDKFPDMEYLTVLRETLELSSEALTFDAKQFAAQLLARLMNETFPSMWQKGAKNSSYSNPTSIENSDVNIEALQNAKISTNTSENILCMENLNTATEANVSIDTKTKEEIQNIINSAAASCSTLLPFKQCLLRPKSLAILDAEEQRKTHNYVNDVRLLFSSHGTDYLIAWSANCDSILVAKDLGSEIKMINNLGVKKIPLTIGSRALLETDEGPLIYDLLSGKVVSWLEKDICYFAVCNESTIAAVKNDWTALALYDIFSQACVWEYKAPRDKNFRNMLVSKYGSVGICVTEDSGMNREQIVHLKNSSAGASASTVQDEIIILDLVSRQERHKLRLKEGEFFYKVCSVSEDGKYLVHLTEPEKHLLVWDLVQGALIHEIEVRPIRLLRLHVSAIGNCIVAVSPDSLLRVWNLQDGTSRFVLSEPVRSIRGGYMDDTHCLSMSEDGKKAIHSVKSNFLFSYVVLWDLIEGKILATFTTDFYGLTFELSPKGDYIVSNMPTGVVILSIHDEKEDVSRGIK